MQSHWRGQGDYVTLGLNIVLSIALGFGAGHWLDTRLHTKPYLALIGFGFGVLAAVRFLVRATQKMARETEQDGFRPASTDRSARFALDQKQQQRQKQSKQESPRERH